MQKPFKIGDFAKQDAIKGTKACEKKENAKTDMVKMIIGAMPNFLSHRKSESLGEARL